jgi:hypothetical protein
LCPWSTANSTSLPSGTPTRGQPSELPLIPSLNVCIPLPHTRNTFSYSSLQSSVIHCSNCLDIRSSLLQLRAVIILSLLPSILQFHHIPSNTMELQHHHSCVLPANGSEFDPSSLGTSLDGPSTQHRGVLQERSINWPHEHSTASPVTNTLYTSSRKPSRSQSPAENVYSHQSNPGGTYFTGNVHAHHIGLAGFGVERPAKQIKLELKRLYQMLDRSDKYKKYREKQPVLTPAEFLAREERERRNKVDKDKSPEKSVWPEFLERAFWTGEWEHFVVARYRFVMKQLTGPHSTH